MSGAILFQVNGKTCSPAASEQLPLLSVLRDDLGLSGRNLDVAKANVVRVPCWSMADHRPPAICRSGRYRTDR